MTPKSELIALAGQWMVFDTNWRFEVVPIAAITDKQVRWIERGRERRGNILSILAVGEEPAMRKVADRLTSAKAEMRRREAAARQWFAAEKARIRDSARARSEAL